MVWRTERKDIYNSVTDEIVAQLEKGVRPWVQPWSIDHATVTRPTRYSGEPYSGINILLLWTRAVTSGFTASKWMTYRQAKQLGAHVSRGEKGTPVVYASSMIKREESNDGEAVQE